MFFSFYRNKFLKTFSNFFYLWGGFYLKNLLKQDILYLLMQILSNIYQINTIYCLKCLTNKKKAVFKPPFGYSPCFFNNFLPSLNFVFCSILSKMIKLDILFLPFMVLTILSVFMNCTSSFISSHFGCLRVPVHTLYLTRAVIYISLTTSFGCLGCLIDFTANRSVQFSHQSVPVSYRNLCYRSLYNYSNC